MALPPNCQPRSPRNPPQPERSERRGWFVWQVRGRLLGWTRGAESGRSGGARARGSEKGEAVGGVRGPEPGAVPGGGALVGARERLGVRGSLSRGASRGASDLSTTGKASVWALPPPLGAAHGVSVAGRTRERPSLAPTGRERGLSPFHRGLLTKSRAYSGGRPEGSHLSQQMGQE